MEAAAQGGPGLRPPSIVEDRSDVKESFWTQVPKALCLFYWERAWEGEVRWRAVGSGLSYTCCHSPLGQSPNLPQGG